MVPVISSPEGRKSMLKLAERMVMSFCTGVGASTAHTWTTLSGSGADDVRVMTRKSMDDPGRPPGVVLSAATSFWLPVPPKRVFDFLRDENSRSEVCTSQCHKLLDTISIKQYPCPMISPLNIYDSGTFFPTADLFKKWRTLPTAVIRETQSPCSAST